MSAAGKILHWDHVTLWVGNAKQAASYYITRLGFEPFAYKGLETGNRNYVAHAVRKNKIIFVFVSAYGPEEEEMGEHLVKHGDSVKDVAFCVDDIHQIVQVTKERGAEIVRDIWEEKDDNGIVKLATIKTFGDTTHTFVDRSGYSGMFLPGFQPVPADPICEMLPDTNLSFIDHMVGNQPENQLKPISSWYENTLMFHRFWSADDNQIDTGSSSLRTVVLKNYEETITMLVTEPGIGTKKSQIQEFVDYNGGPGVAHIAFYTNDIIDTVRNLKKRGLEFMSIPDSYYDIIGEKLSTSKINITEDLKILKELRILIDFDEGGYLLQIFTRPMQDRPTLFLEIIQRYNFNGFGVGNIKSLFRAIEIEQGMRGNL